VNFATEFCILRSTLTKVIVTYSDGACSGNPGPAGVGVVLKENDKNIKEFSKYIGDATNNIAEYTALIYALQEALKERADVVNAFVDSELVYKQVIGEYKVKNEKIKQLHDQVLNLMEGFQQVNLRHVLREYNKEADNLASSAIKKQAKMVAPLFENSEEESPSSKG